MLWHSFGKVCAVTWSIVGTLHSAHVLCTPWPWEVAWTCDKDMHHSCTSSFRFRVDSMSMYSSIHYSFHPSPSAWLLLEETQVCSCFGGNLNVWHSLGARRTSGNRKEKHSWKPFELCSASRAKEMLLRTEDPPKQWLELFSHSQLRKNNSQGQTEAEVLLASSWESTR